MTDVKRLLYEATPLPWPEDYGQAIGDDINDPADAALAVYAVNRLPDYEAAVDALERLINVGDALWEDHPPVWMSEADEARAALRRLREKAAHV